MGNVFGKDQQKTLFALYINSSIFHMVMKIS